MSGTCSTPEYPHSQLALLKPQPPVARGALLIGDNATLALPDAEHSTVETEQHGGAAL